MIAFLQELLQCISFKYLSQEASWKCTFVNISTNDKYLDLVIRQVLLSSTAKPHRADTENFVTSCGWVANPYEETNCRWLVGWMTATCTYLRYSDLQVKSNRRFQVTGRNSRYIVKKMGVRFSWFSNTIRLLGKVYLDRFASDLCKELGLSSCISSPFASNLEKVFNCITKVGHNRVQRIWFTGVLPCAMCIPTTNNSGPAFDTLNFIRHTPVYGSGGKQDGEGGRNAPFHSFFQGVRGAV